MHQSVKLLANMNEKTVECYQKIRDCCTKINELRTALPIHPFHIYFLTQSWLDLSINIEKLDFTSQKNYRYKRSTITSTKSRGRGQIISLPKFITSSRLKVRKTLNNCSSLDTPGKSYSWMCLYTKIYENRIEALKHKYIEVRMLLIDNYNFPNIHWLTRSTISINYLNISFYATEIINMSNYS